ncbi:hypothetical protein EJP81_22980 (plasmid) [Rahnella aquatilis]|jgi:hypothetical protein|nr:hypothetical protein EJP79_22980 [Rahnella aquatilis]QEU51544.1 hypothetical protein EJP81_22980 [Rahnella aquatilis]
MTEERYYDYLVLGGENHGEVYSTHLVDVLEVPAKNNKLAKMYAQNAPADVTEIETVPHKVTEFITEDGRHYFIASNEDLQAFNIEDEILKSKISVTNN